MIFFRLSKAKYARDLSGRGAEISGGRWNSKGVPVLYTGASRALCTTEVAVHTPLGNIPTDYELTTLEVPHHSIAEIDPSTWPADWKSYPHSHSTQEIGDQFLKANQYLILKVPSVVVQGDFNFLLNPLHPAFKAVRIVSTEPFAFDERLFK